MKKKLLFILLISVCVSACGDTLKSSWSNFRAYYNTFYNAKEYFSAGLKKVQEQPVVIDPLAPVRVHPSPVPAGAQEFEQAIEKGLQVLQHYSETQWRNDALLLTGKAYYYRQEYYPALQKFEELQEYSTSSEMRNRAVVWKGRTLLDLGLHTEGVDFLEAEIERRAESQYPSLKAEMQVLAAEHYAMMKRWQQSAYWLSQAIPHLDTKQLTGRSFFLYGQVLEHNQRYGEAYFAYSKVRENFAGFEYEYWSGFKQADVARKEGNLDLALSLYEDLMRDDKNINYYDHLAYQIARTWEMQGNFERAINEYNLLLESRDSRSREFRADVYYRLGSIYGDIYEKFSVAAAYYDSSAMITRTPSEEQGTDTQQLSEAYSRYLDLQEQVSHADSLLWLGSLSQEERESVLEEVRLQKRQQLLSKREKENDDKLVNQTLQANDNQSSTSPMYGFLNHQNADLVQQGQKNFNIIWGNRPLVDNWRRMDVVQRQITHKEPARGTPDMPAQEALAEAVVNTEEIPTTAEQRQALREKQMAAHYELGNLLLFTLNRPDNARYHFHRVLNAPVVQEDLQAKAMYSLYESFRAEYEGITGEKASPNDVWREEDQLVREQAEDSLRFWERKLVSQFPGTKYAQRVGASAKGQAASGEGQVSEYEAAADRRSQIRNEFEAIVATPGPFKGARLRSLARNHKELDLAPYIYYKAVEDYISQAKAMIEISASYPPFYSPLEKPLPLNKQDSLQLEKGRLSDFQRQLDQPYFQHTYWDSVRVVLREFDELFPEAAQSQQVAKLRAALDTD